MRNSVFVTLFIIATQIVVRAQGFSSGSTGSDGPLDLASMTCTVCTLQLPDSGVFNFTTINVPNGKALQFSKNLRNTPVIMLAQGAVTIAGTVMVDAVGRAGGPGGFDGGNAGNGFGPGGGTSINKNGKWIGPLSLVPIIGGSGAWGGGAGGGGGGALVIASSSSISVTATGSIRAMGSSAVSAGAGNGSGGAIRLVANSVSVAGNLSAFTSSVSEGTSGTIRIESPSGSFTGTGFPVPALSTTVNSIIIPNNNTPSLSITSIAGFAVPSAPAARSDVVDLLLPSQLSDPINVVVHAHNIPAGTVVSMTVGTNDIVSKPSPTVVTGMLSGTFDSSTTTLSVSGLSRTAVSTLFAFATFAPPNSAQTFNPKGQNHVARIQVEARLNGKSTLRFFRANGTEIAASKLPVRFLKQFMS